MTRLLAAAFACGATPLAIGTAIYLAWRATRWDGFMVMGLATILLGLVAFLVGMTCLALHLSREAGVQPERSWRQAILVGGLLLINFPAAFLCVRSANDIATRYTLTVENQSGEVIDRLVFEGACPRLEFEKLKAGARLVYWFQPEFEGPATFEARLGDKRLEGVVDLWVTAGQSLTLRIKQNGGFHVAIGK